MPKSPDPVRSLATPLHSPADIERLFDALSIGVAIAEDPSCARVRVNHTLATLHELRTPLNALLGWTQMLKSTALDEPSRRRALDSVERNAHAQRC